MAKQHYQVLILGGGTGGIMVAAQLRRKEKSLDIGLIEPSDKHYYQPAFTLVGGGTYKYEHTIHRESSVIPKGVDWIKDRVTKIDPENNRVETAQSGTITYDYMVVSLGVKYDLDALSGLAETMNKNNVCSNYTDSKYTWEVLKNFKGGNAIFTQTHLPIKCGGAPQKIMWLTEHYLRKHKLREKSNVVYAYPGTVIFGAEPWKSTLIGMAKDRHIIQKQYYKIERIDGPNHKVWFSRIEDRPESEITLNDPTNKLGEKNQDGLYEMDFDMLHLAPPMSPPQVLQDSPLAIREEGPEKGYAKVDINYLFSLDFPNVYVVGDSANLPAAKTGASIRKQAPVMVEHMVAKIQNRQPNTKPYTGYGSCPIVTGYGRMLLAEFGYDNVRMTDPMIKPFFDVSKPLWSMWILKKYGLPFLYWKFMVKGLM